MVYSSGTAVKRDLHQPTPCCSFEESLDGVSLIFEKMYFMLKHDIFC